MLVVPKMLTRLSRLMQAICACHAPAELENEGNCEKVDKTFHASIVTEYSRERLCLVACR